MNNPSDTDAAGVVVFDDARVIVGDGAQVFENASVFVQDGLIVDVGSPQTMGLPAGATRISLAGRTVMPTILNLHGHIGYMKDGITDAANYSRENVLDHLRRLTFYGVSVFQSLGTDRDDTEITIRDEQRRGQLSDPTLALLRTAGNGLVAPTPDAPNGGPFFATDVIREASSPDEARRLVRELAAKNPDIIKFWVDDRNGTKAKFTPDIYQAIVDEAHVQGLPAVAHIYDLDDAKGVIRAGVNGIAHMVREEPGPDDELIELLIANDVFACTSMSIQRAFHEPTDWLDDPALADTMSSAAIARWKAEISSVPASYVTSGRAAYAVLEASVRRYAEAGVKVVLSGDTGLMSQALGFAEHRELESMVLGGVPALAAIRAATQIPAEVMGLTDRGTVQSGKRADLLVLDGNPLDDISNTRKIAAVYYRGAEVDRASLTSAWRT
jgi:imidazolonepropionase-like amidohydrolase